MMKQFYRAKLTLEAMHKDYRIATTNKKETSITNAATGDTFVEVQTTEEAKETTKEINNMESDEQVEVEVECTGVVLGTTIRQYVTKASLGEAMERQISGNNRLQHDVVNLSSTILREQTKLSGFEDTGLKWYQFSQIPGKFVQILHVASEEHWVLLYRGVSEEVNLCDSLFRGENNEYPEDILKSICRIAACSRASLRINCLPVQQQGNAIDCGIFVIAFATDICFHIDPCQSSYDHGKMREHLLTCLQLDEFTPFSKIKRRVKRSRSYHLYENIYCICRQNFTESDTDNPDFFMARYMECYDWYHKKCMNINKIVFLSEKEHKKWKCSQCK